MEDLTNLPMREYPVLDENMIQLMDLPEISEPMPPVISFYSPEVMAVEDDDELKQVDQFHGEELENSWKLVSCGDKSSQSSSIEQEGSRGRTSDIMALLEIDENNRDYTRSNNRITKSWSTDSGWWMAEHLLFDILILLPVATLLRFKSICKLWHALISSSNFIAQHLDHNRGKDNIIGFHCQFDKHGKIASYKSCLLSGNKYEIHRNFDCENFVKDPAGPNRFSSDGIICIVHSDLQEVVDLWNPAMKQLRRLPESEQLRRLPKPSFSYRIYDYFICYGVGYCVRSDDYKVVRIFVDKDNADNNVVEVYSLRADSWRTILEDGMLSFKSLFRHVSSNGTCFWIASDNTHDAEYRDDSVVSFDLNDETFGTMPLPENTSDFSVLDFLGDKLAFISGLKNPIINILGSRYYEIWVLHEYGVKESWSKIWKIGPTDIPYSNDVYFPFGFSTNGDYLLLTNPDTLGRGPLYAGNVFMYNLGTQENEYIELRSLDREINLFARCMESLVSVKRVSAGSAACW